MKRDETKLISYSAETGAKHLHTFKVADEDKSYEGRRWPHTVARGMISRRKWYFTRHLKLEGSWATQKQIASIRRGMGAKERTWEMAWKAGRALKNTLSSDFGNLPKTLVCVLQHLQTSVSSKEKRLGLGSRALCEGRKEEWRSLRTGWLLKRRSLAVGVGRPVECSFIFR